MKKTKKLLVWVFLFASVMAFSGVAQAEWIEGTIGYVKQIRVDLTTTRYEVRLDREGDSSIYRDVLAENLKEFLAIALTAQANGSTVKLQHEDNGFGKAWYGILLVSPSP